MLIRIATRQSDLALWQANYVANTLRSLAESPQVELIHITTSGDQDQSSPLATFGGTGAFTKEVQQAVIDDRADVAVHSLKDLPTEPTPGLTMAAVPQRASAFDSLLFPPKQVMPSTVSQLPHGLRIGTGSPRRASQLRRLNPQLTVQGIRGNVPTRIRKLDDGEFDAIVLAEAGLDRLALGNRMGLRLQPPQFFAAVGQGALGIECRTGDATLIQQLQALTCPQTLQNVTAERSLLHALQAGCHAPVGVATRRDDNQLELTGVLLSLDGSTRLEHTARAAASQATELGQAVADQLLRAGGGPLLANES
jgi:hydroxymethylbilane synthase